MPPTTTTLQDNPGMLKSKNFTASARQTVALPQSAADAVNNACLQASILQTGPAQLAIIQPSALHCCTSPTVPLNCCTVQTTDLHCGTLQTAASQCSSLQTAASQCRTMQTAALLYTTLERAALHCSAEQTPPLLPWGRATGISTASSKSTRSRVNCPIRRATIARPTSGKSSCFTTGIN